MKKIVSLLITITLLFGLSACSQVDKNYGVTEDVKSSGAASTANDESSEIISLDQKMSNYFDITLFDEENYSEIYLGKKFEYDVTYDGCNIAVPQKMEKFIQSGWQLAEGSSYNENSLIFAKETVSLNFVNQNGATVWALFYNSSNKSIKLIDCEIVKFKIDNNFQTTDDYKKFDVNNITNTSSVTELIDILGTPSHFYQVTDNDYYFDYFLTKKDRRNKIRVYVNLFEDAITAIEFSYYK